MRRGILAASLAVAALLTVAGRAGGAEDRGAAGDGEARAVEQPFLYMTDTHGPAPKQVLAGYALAFSSSAGAIRPVPGRFDSEAVVNAFSLEAGIVPHLSIFGTTMIAEAIGHSEVGAVAVQAGARVLLTPQGWQRFRLVLQASFLREFGADLGVAGELTGSYELGRVRLAASVHAEHIFASGRDAVDLYAVLGVSVRVHRLVRVGAEYVAEDLEAGLDGDDAELGARHYLGPDLALSLWKNRVLVTAGTAVQVARAPGILARGAVTYVF
jgi:hypothetical protein